MSFLDTLWGILVSSCLFYLSWCYSWTSGLELFCLLSSLCSKWMSTWQGRLRSSSISTPKMSDNEGSGPSSGEDIGFTLQLMQALKDPQVAAQFRNAIAPLITPLQDALQQNTAQITILRAQLPGRDDTIQNLQSHVQALEIKIDDLEQHGRKGSIRVFGCPKTAQALWKISCCPSSMIMSRWCRHWPSMILRLPIAWANLPSRPLPRRPQCPGEVMVTMVSMVKMAIPRLMRCSSPLPLQCHQRNIEHISLNIDGQDIAEVTSSKFVGVIIDDKLNWRDHVSFVCRKVARGLGVIIKARKVLQKGSLINLYYSFIYPYLIYCNQIWGSACKTQIELLFISQKKALRIITGVHPRSPSEPLFRQLEFLNCDNIFKYLVGRLMYRVYHGE